MAVNEPLLDEAQLNEGNLMTVTLASMYSPPETWALTGTQYMYGAAMPVPVTGEVSVGLPVVSLQPHERILICFLIKFSHTHDT